MALDFTLPKVGFAGPTHYSYLPGYVISHANHLYSPLDCAVSARLPLGFDLWFEQTAPAFLLDIVPSGAAGKFLARRLLHENTQGLDRDLFLLGRCGLAPVGNLRVKEALGYLEGVPVVGFTRDEVIARDAGFLEYAYEQGAAIGGATGAGGEAPKLLLVEDQAGRIFPDAVLADHNVARHWFVKFARNQGLQRDLDVLTSEFCYYRAAHAIGLDTVPVEGLALEAGAKPSLWMQRFDRAVTDAGIERTAVESIYSLAGIIEPGAYMEHTEVIRCLVELWQSVGQADQVDDLIAEYLMRDLLNQILGNSDNHCRNMSILRTPAGVKLAPIYDLAPMVMDSEGVTRSTKWAAPIEHLGQVDWLQACQALAEWTNPGDQFERLKANAQRLLALPDLLSGFGVPEVTLNHPIIALRNLPQWLSARGLN